MSGAATTIWLVVHCELVRVQKKMIVDEAVFHAFSSLRRAERFVKAGKVEPFSWWKVLRLELDNTSASEIAFYYNHKGKAVKSAPFKQAKRCL